METKTETMERVEWKGGGVGRKLGRLVWGGGERGVQKSVSLGKEGMSASATG